LVTRLALLAQEKAELVETPEAELAELTALYAAKGLSAQTAATVAAELTAHDALAAHIDAELNIDPEDLADPVQATVASALSFTLGALLPLLAILLPPPRGGCPPPSWRCSSRWRSPGCCPRAWVEATLVAP